MKSMSIKKHLAIPVIFLIIASMLIIIGIESFHSKEIKENNKKYFPSSRLYEDSYDGEVYRYLEKGNIYMRDEGEESKIGTYKYEKDKKKLICNYDSYYRNIYEKEYNVFYYSGNILILENKNAYEMFYKSSNDLELDRYYNRVPEELPEGYYDYYYNGGSYIALYEMKFLPNNEYRLTYKSKYPKEEKLEKYSGTYKVYRLKKDYQFLNETGLFPKYRIELEKEIGISYIWTDSITVDSEETNYILDENNNKFYFSNESKINDF